MSVQHYRRYAADFREALPRTATPETVRAACAHLVLGSRVLDEIGPAVNGGHSIFIYGPPGNGKTEMARAIRGLLPGTIAVPHAVAAGDELIRFLDPSVHEPATPVAEADDETCDRRWVSCRRPMVSVGGELTLEALSLIYNARAGVYRAPVQALANGGILLIDEFGRERCHHRDLLNWWMVPLESGLESLSLLSGEKIEMPFFPLVVFATNLRPSELVDEAFLRRIRHKIYAANPTPEDFIQIFERVCRAKGVAFDRVVVEQLLKRVYRPLQIELRGCHPRDLIDQALALANYRGDPAALTFELLETVSTDYFVTGRGMSADDLGAGAAIQAD